MQYFVNVIKLTVNIYLVEQKIDGLVLSRLGRPCQDPCFMHKVHLLQTSCIKPQTSSTWKINDNLMPFRLIVVYKNDCIQFKQYSMFQNNEDLLCSALSNFQVQMPVRIWRSISVDELSLPFVLVVLSNTYPMGRRLRSHIKRVVVRLKLILLLPL